MTDIVRRIILVAIVLSLPLASSRADTSAALIKDIQPGPIGSSLSHLVDVDGTLFFTADDGVTGNELWKSDGTEAGTMLVEDIVPGIYGSFGYDPDAAEVIESNIIGTDGQSVPEPGNGEHGILIRNSANNVIGGSVPAKRNVVSNNGRSGTGGCGIAIMTSTDNRVVDNRIGTDVAGMTNLANIGSGVCLEDAGFNSIGGAGLNDGNLITGNAIVANI